MEDITFQAIIDGVATPGHRPMGNKLAVATMPEPFVSPTFKRFDDHTNPFGEVLFIRASAAVGKSTIARAISAKNQIPILDLAKTSVATGSLKGLLLDLKNGRSPMDSFHLGELPVIIDALDEGRLRSNESGFFSFLETSADLLTEDRSTPNKVKLILLGRPEAIDYAQLAFSILDIRSSTLDVGFFDKDSAKALIIAYASATTSGKSTHLIHKVPADNLIDAYFDRIEEALGLDKGSLWNEDRGKTFAGYAPVLAAVGSLLPEIENFAEALVRLSESGTRDAWSVIETVLQEIIGRERNKLISQMQNQVSVDLPPEAYDSDEQLSLLMQFVQGQILDGTGRVRLPPADSTKYYDLVRQWISEHPFIKSNVFSNDVLASFVFANAILQDRPIDRSTEQLATLSRQPFLWRSLSNKLIESTLIDGKYLGFILSSFWSDPLTSDDQVFIRDSQEGSGSIVTLSSRGKDDVQFLTATPIALFGQAKNADIDIQGDISMEGVGEAVTSAFFLRGDNSIICQTLKISATQIKVSGRLWLDAEAISSPAQLLIDNQDNSAQLGWGKSIKAQYPFNRHPPTIQDPNLTFDKTTLDSLLDECAKRFTSGAALTLNPDYSPPENDTYTQWAHRRFREQFPAFIALLVKHGFATSEPMPVSGAGKARVRFSFGWPVITNAIKQPSASNSVFASDIQALFS